MTRILALLFVMLSAAPAMAFDPAAMTDAERTAFREEIRSYLLENPEVLMEAIGVLEQRQVEAEVAGDVALARDNADALFNDAASFVGGNPDGDITIVEFMDYRCGYCRKAFPEVEALIATDGNIRFIVKEFPILGEQSVLASKFAVAVLQLHGGEIYKNVHDTLMSVNSDITMESLERLAATYELDMPTIAARMESPEVSQVLLANSQLAQTMKISGTPTFVIQDQMLRGYVPLDKMATIVANLRSGG